MSRPELISRFLAGERVPVVHRCACGAVVVRRNALCAECSSAESDVALDARLARAMKLIGAVPASLEDRFRRDANPRLIDFADMWMPEDGPVLILGKGRRFKTTACQMVAHRLVKAARASRDRAAVRQAAGIRLFLADALALARVESSLGVRPEIVEEAAQATLLFIDDLGFEQRPRGEGTDIDMILRVRSMPPIRPTVVTSARPEALLQERYGDGVTRRTFDQGRIIDLFEKPKAST